MRRVTPAIILAGIVVLAIYWGLTETWFDHVAATEAPYTPNLANGQMIFNAGGCASCHAVPGQPDRGGRMGTRPGKADHQQGCNIGGKGGGWFSRLCRESSNASGRCYKGAAAYP